MIVDSTEIVRQLVNQDAILFPDLIHAVKSGPNNEISQREAAHYSAWVLSANC
jgi:catalase